MAKKSRPDDRLKKSQYAAAIWLLLLTNFCPQEADADEDLAQYLSPTLEAISDHGRSYAFDLTVSFHPLRSRAVYGVEGYARPDGMVSQLVWCTFSRRNRRNWQEFNYEGRTVIRWLRRRDAPDVDVCLPGDPRNSLPLPNEILRRLGPHLVKPSRIVSRLVTPGGAHYNVQYESKIDAVVLGLPAVLVDGEFTFYGPSKLLQDYTLGLEENDSAKGVSFPLVVQGRLIWRDKTETIPAEITELLQTKSLFESLARVPALARYARKSPLVLPEIPPLFSNTQRWTVEANAVRVPLYEFVLARSDSVILAIRMLYITQNSSVFEFWYWENDSTTWKPSSTESNLFELFQVHPVAGAPPDTEIPSDVQNKERLTLDLGGVSIWWSAGGWLYFEGYPNGENASRIEYANTGKLNLSEINPFDPDLTWVSKPR